MYCLVPENIPTPPSPHSRDLIFLGMGGRFSKAKNFGKCMKLNWNYSRGMGVLRKIPSMGEVWIIYGTYIHINFV